MTSTRKIIAVVPAAGIGSRMQADKPKQYLHIHGQPILQHTLNVLLAYPHISRIVLAVAADDPYIDQLKLSQNPKIQLVEGGETRADSVLNGLNAVQDAGADVWVMVHDAARPCLTHGDLEKLLEIQDDNGAILAIPATDTIKRALPSQQIAHTEDRSQLWLAQTPQFFRADLLRDALTRAKQQQFAVTDEASAMELAGFRPHLVAGRSDNIKVTRPEDLALAEFYLTRKTI
ncbi:2-C-methyl-D-erythritol 4-phosphate cytidylyltransferase [Aggregatibacter actinomycetemcomitans]|uniref:2-C-methyl-D-erythritol 4-phosphate cytidylyltransferase n=1 Tax=Aggregatibacter actinomycetemcomitans TaxID=714 RepID=UPI0001B9F795|nr:2-C-methyl-D-erythritol 4-phosphate cytidylyltransferase [Aggregatibacter actinomycetemcomitans]AEW76698.1 2-C-methyl-D-erythritol 4-phosphate cytidylyltransferase [Aggregatibacter actinomycetemcomitans ANH9381]ACX81780.1 2-C-methyl-D-erythritol 4-phosphate cytidylyltransferase [Aggregatibacter actinomycetemcomitans D11S-1]AHN71782.1 4-diphosphocytidyl-2C-methyl-D-erythritolsynthase, putative' [Aggregatibacter actinomycetemcomitans HK1651]AMQ92727.1 2-C-methyl-D-erythritol 4-phosphate cytidy